MPILACEDLSDVNEDGSVFVDRDEIAVLLFIPKGDRTEVRLVLKGNSEPVIVMMSRLKAVEFVNQYKKIRMGGGGK